jgi:hypothetical protein
MHSGDRAAALLKEWPPPKRRELLSSPRLCAPQSAAWWRCVR